MQMIELVRTLRAVRRFAAQPIPDAVLQDLLEVARWTGSAKNTQPWELVVVTDRELLVQLARFGQYAEHLADAPLALALVMHHAAQAFDAGRLAQNIMVAAWAHGVGSCIASLFPDENERQAKALLEVPTERSLQTAISLGYPADAAARRLRSAPPGTRTAVPTGRKALEELVSWECYGRHVRS
jgi:nitroreductase